MEDEQEEKGSAIGKKIHISLNTSQVISGASMESERDV